MRPESFDETAMLPYELLNADPSFDVWSLGCILYQMCTEDVTPLFQCGQDDCLTDKLTENDNLFALADWEADYKASKLSRITDRNARNLLGQILQKDPAKRPKLSRVLAHPFLSGKKVARMVGEQAKWDVFIEYRVNSEAAFAAKLYMDLTNQGFRVFWDKVALEAGVNWEEGFCSGLVSSKVYVPLMSRKGINNPDRDWQNFSKLKADDPRCDNVFLGMRLAVELHEMGLIEMIFPIFIADLDESTNEYGKYFASGCHPALSDIAIEVVEKKLKVHMDNQALGTPLKPNNTVKKVVEAITNYQGAFIEGPADVAFNEAVERLSSMLSKKKELTIDPNPSSSTTPIGSLQQLQTLLTVEQDRTTMLQNMLAAEKELKATAESELKDLIEGRKRAAVVDYRDLDEYSLFQVMNPSAKVKYLSEKVFTKAELAAHKYEFWFYMVFEAKPPFEAHLDQTADLSGYATKVESTDEYRAAYAKLCDRVVDYVKKDNKLAYEPNNQGMEAVKNARGTEMRMRIREVVLWHGRYMTSEDRPTHQSATCLVFKATDVRKNSFVALKLMRRKDQYDREIEQRRRLNAFEGSLNKASEYVVLDVDRKEGKLEAGNEEGSWPEVSYTTLDQEPEQASVQANELTVSASDVPQEQQPEKTQVTIATFVSKQFAEKYYLIVMPLADKNLFSAFKSERWAGKNIHVNVRQVFIHLVTCVQYMHDKGVLHADLKTMNIIRSDGQWKLIDLDAACEIGKEHVGHKSSSAYVPPEAIYLNEEVESLRRALALAKKELKTLLAGDTQFKKKIVQDKKIEDLSQRLAVAEASARTSGDGSRPCVRSVEAVTKGEATYELLTAHPSFDVWSLGCILYQMCNEDVKPLFQGGREDNLVADLTDDDNLFALAEWSPELKDKKLARVTDTMARNLLSQMLHKDPLQRPSLARVLTHSFLSGKKVARLIGEKPKYDVFLSYRVASDTKHVETLYNLLVAKGLKVFLDKKCLEDGAPWEQGFCEGLVCSRAFVPFFSRDAINHPTIAWQNFSNLTANSDCDNVFLEHRLAVELHGLGLIDKIFPIFIGNLDATTSEYSRYTFFGGGYHPTLTEVSVESVEKKLRHHLDSQALGTPLEPDRTVKSAVGAVTAFQGAFIEGPADTSFATAAASIVKMLTSPATLMRKSSTSSMMVKSPRGGMYFQKALYDSLQGKLHEVQRLNNSEFETVEQAMEVRNRVQTLLQGNATTEL